MADALITEWQEQIPDESTLYMRAHRDWFKASGELKPGIFRNRDDGMSTDWEKYSTPEESRNRGRTPGDNAIIAMSVADIRAIPEQQVEHWPILTNQSHTEVFGEKTPEARFRFMKIFRLILPLDPA